MEQCKMIETRTHDEASKYRQKYFNSTAQKAHSVFAIERAQRGSREIFESICRVNHELLYHFGLTLAAGHSVLPREGLPWDSGSPE